MRQDFNNNTERHAASLSQQGMRKYVRKKGMSDYPALQMIPAQNFFPTHTPVPAGNDAFSRDLVGRYLGKYAHDFGLSFDDLFALGQPMLNPPPLFSMTILALRTSRRANGVSKLHGEVSKGLWQDVWAGIPLPEVPITSITNGIHTKTWTAPEFHRLYEKYLGTDWADHLTDIEYWRRVIDIPDEVLWETHQLLKRRLIEFVHYRLRIQRARIADSPDLMLCID